MRHFLKAIAAFSLTLELLLVPARAQDAQNAAAYAKEQALVAQLSTSHSYQDHRKLAEMLRNGVIASAENPLRRSDRDGAIAAYRRAIALGDRSAGTFVALARVLLRESEEQGLADLRPTLRSLVLQGSGDAAYVLALDAAQNQKLPPAEITQKLEAAAIMGSVSAVVDLVGSGAAVGGPTVKASLGALQTRALSGWAPASFALYQTYNEGRLVERSPETAMKWLALASDQGHLAAMEQLAENLLHGTDVAMDRTRAVALYRSAAEAGSAAAALELGRSLSREPNSGPAMLAGAPAMDVSLDEGRTWLRRAAEVGFHGAAEELTNLELGLILKAEADPTEKAQRIAAAIAPIAGDPDALASLANRYWKTSTSGLIGPPLLALLKEHTLQGNPSAGMAYNAWLQAGGEMLSSDVARALIEGLHRQPLRSVAFSNFLIADLVLDKRIPADVPLPTDAITLLVQAADEKVGQAMLRLGMLYQQGGELAHSKTFAKRWFVAAKAQAVERAAWDLAALQISDDDPAERAEAERFYLQRLDEEDVRAGFALARYRLQSGEMDPSTLAQVKAVMKRPGDMVEFASILLSNGTVDNVERGKQLLAGLDETKLDIETRISYGRLLILIAASDAEAQHGIKLLEEAAATGTTTAKIALASTYLSSITYRDRQEYAVQLLNGVLKENPQDHDAKLLMSKAYLVGLGTKRDARQASALIESVRAEGEYRNPKATMLAADWLAFSATNRDPVGAETLLKAQAARGSIAADRALGEFYLSGFGPSLEPDIAASRLYDAAQAGDKEAMAALGHLLLNGYGVSKSQAEGLAWLGRAAEAGNTAAMYELSRIFALGPAGEIDGNKIVYWLTRAAGRNHPNASYQLGLAYLKGEWVEPDVDQSITWFERSAAAGNLLAARTVETLRRQTAEGVAPDASVVSHE